MKKSDIVLLKEDSSQSSSDYIRAQQAGYLCVVDALSGNGETANVMVPSRQEGSSDTDILYSKNMTIKRSSLEPVEDVFDNMRSKS